MEHPQHHPLSRRGIRHGSQNIKTSPNAQLFTNRRHGLHGRMIHGCEQKRDPAFLHAFHHLTGVQIDLDAQCLQYVGAAASARYASIPRLGHDASACGGQYHRCRGYIDGIGSVASGTYDIQ
eukprot:scaffold27417_cov42-Cyclotella_meneghiniana.AAC.1